MIYSENDAAWNELFKIYLCWYKMPCHICYHLLWCCHAISIKYRTIASCIVVYMIKLPYNIYAYTLDLPSWVYMPLIAMFCLQIHLYLLSILHWLCVDTWIYMLSSKWAYFYRTWSTRMILSLKAICTELTWNK